LTISLAFIAVVSAGSISYVKRTDGYGSEVGYSSGGGVGEWSGADYKGDYHAYPKYKFEYGVKDPHTHDHKSQWESRDGDVVKGQYTLDEADGTVRKVSYHADGKTGFHAKVERIGKAHHEQGSFGDSSGYGFGY
jgi:hypothetical protein